MWVLCDVYQSGPDLLTVYHIFSGKCQGGVKKRKEEHHSLTSLTLPSPGSKLQRVTIYNQLGGKRISLISLIWLLTKIFYLNFRYYWKRVWDFSVYKEMYCLKMGVILLIQRNHTINSAKFRPCGGHGMGHLEWLQAFEDSSVPQMDSSAFVTQIPSSFFF